MEVTVNDTRSRKYVTARDGKLVILDDRLLFPSGKSRQQLSRLLTEESLEIGGPCEKWEAVRLDLKLQGRTLISKRYEILERLENPKQRTPRLEFLLKETQIGQVVENHSPVVQPVRVVSAPSRDTSRFTYSQRLGLQTIPLLERMGIIVVRGNKKPG